MSTVDEFSAVPRCQLEQSDQHQGRDVSAEEIHARAVCPGYKTQQLAKGDQSNVAHTAHDILLLVAVRLMLANFSGRECPFFMLYIIASFCF